MLRTDKLSRINRRLTALLAAGLVLSSPMRFPGIAKAEGVAPDSQVTVRPVDEVSEETVLREAAELAEGTPVTEHPGESDEDSGTVRPTACSERGDHYPVSNKKDLFIPVGIDFKSGPGGTTTAAVQRTLATSLSVQLGATFKAGAIVASAEANMSITGTVTATIQETHTYSHNISANKYGHLRYGNWGWKMDLQKFHDGRELQAGGQDHLRQGDRDAERHDVGLPVLGNCVVVAGEAKMMQLSTVARRITGGAALLALLAGVSACTGDDDRGAAQSSPASSASTGPSAAAPNDAEMQQYRMAVDDANANVAATIIAAGGRPTVVRQGAQANTMVIRDEGAEAWQAGNYRLVVYCAGSGTLYANFRLGSTAQIEELPPCSPSVTTGAVSLRLAAAAKGSAVIIIPAGNTNAAVSYQIQRG